MKKTALVLVLVLASLGSYTSGKALAERYQENGKWWEDGWKGPGYYVVADVITAEAIDAGPYASQSECAVALKNGKWDGDHCDYFAVRPGLVPKEVN